MSTIRKTTKKVTKEAMAKKIFADLLNELTIEQKNEFWIFLGRIACGEIKNFYSTRIYKKLTKDANNDQRAVIAYICKKTSELKVFEDMTDLLFAKEK